MGLGSADDLQYSSIHSQFRSNIGIFIWVSASCLLGTHREILCAAVDGLVAGVRGLHEHSHQFLDVLANFREDSIRVKLLLFALGQKQSLRRCAPLNDSRVIIRELRALSQDEAFGVGYANAGG